MRASEFTIILLPPLIFYSAIFWWLRRYSGKRLAGFSLLEFVLLIVVAGGFALLIETRSDATAGFVRANFIPVYAAGHIIAAAFVARWLDARRFVALIAAVPLSLIGIAGCGSFTLWLAIAFKIWKVE